MPAAKPPRSNSMNVGEFIVILTVILSVASVIYFTFVDPQTTRSTIWAGAWGVMFGAGFIARTRRKSTIEGTISIPECILVVMVWGIAATAIAMLGGEIISAGWTAFWGFIAASMAGESILRLRSKKEGTSKRS